MEYHKIKTIFARDVQGTKKLMEGVYNDKTIEFLKDSTWEMTEKIDGTNIRVVWDGHRVSFGGRTESAQIPAHLVNKLNSLFGTPEAEELFEQKFGAMTVTLFGEGYGEKINSGGNYISNGCDFILFDVFINGNFQPRSSVEDVAAAFGIKVVPIVLTGTLQQGVDFVKGAPKSTIGTANMEGVVARPKQELRDRAGNRIIVKIKVKDFITTRS